MGPASAMAATERAEITPAPAPVATRARANPAKRSRRAESALPSPRSARRAREKPPATQTIRERTRDEGCDGGRDGVAAHGPADPASARSEPSGDRGKERRHDLAVHVSERQEREKHQHEAALGSIAGLGRGAQRLYAFRLQRAQVPPEADTTSSGEQPISVDEVAHFETPPRQLLCDESPMAFPGVLLGAQEGELTIPLREQKRDSRGEALRAHVLLVARFPKSPERFPEMQVIDAFFGEKRFEYSRPNAGAGGSSDSAARRREARCGSASGERERRRLAGCCDRMEFRSTSSPVAVGTAILVAKTLEPCLNRVPLAPALWGRERESFLQRIPRLALPASPDVELPDPVQGTPSGSPRPQTMSRSQAARPASSSSAFSRTSAASSRL